MILVDEIVRRYLEKNGYDGLFNPWMGCACKLDDLFPCDVNDGMCQPGHFVPCPDDVDADWCIGKRKAKEVDE